MSPPAATDIDPTDFLIHLSPAALIAHVRAAAALLLSADGPELTSAQAMLAHEVDEAMTEYEGREDTAALARRLARERRPDGRPHLNIARTTA